jgi:predicted glycosyltransferase
MRLWIDLANSPHVPFFRALTNRFQSMGHEVEITAREFAETVPLARAAGMLPETIGRHGGRELSGKAGSLLTRAVALSRWARTRKFDRALSHNSYSQILAARLLRLSSVTLMDYEFQPANHLAFRFASRVIVPESFPEERLRRYGAARSKVRRYRGTKEDVYLAAFEPDQLFGEQLCKFGISADNVLVLMRPPAHEALYHRFHNTLFDEALSKLLTIENVKVMLLPRTEGQRATYQSRAHQNLVIPSIPMDGPNLIAASDLVISAGGTINREAAALGVPVASIYAGRWAAVDEQLIREGRLRRIVTADDLDQLRLEKKSSVNPRRSNSVLNEVTNLILN